MASPIAVHAAAPNQRPARCLWLLALLLLQHAACQSNLLATGPPTDPVVEAPSSRRLQALLFSGSAAAAASQASSSPKDAASKEPCIKFGSQFDVPLQGSNVVLDCPSTYGAANKRVCCAAHYPTLQHAQRNATFVRMQEIRGGRGGSSGVGGVGGGAGGGVGGGGVGGSSGVSSWGSRGVGWSYAEDRSGLDRSGQGRRRLAEGGAETWGGAGVGVGAGAGVGVGAAAGVAGVSTRSSNKRSRRAITCTIEKIYHSSPQVS